MGIPSFDEILGPVLKAHQSGEKHVQEICDEVARILNLTEEDMQETISGKRQRRIPHRVGLAKSSLKNAGLIKLTKRGYSEITSKGLEALESGAEINRRFLKQFDPFREFTKYEDEIPSNQKDSVEMTDEDDDIPEEAIKRNIDTINEMLAKTLLTQVLAEESKFFENLIVELMLAMGYGEKGGMSKVIGGSGDGGVDGVISQDELGIEKFYLQAKNYAPERKITSSDIRNFAGALSQKGVDKGVFVTTSSFTQDAEKTADEVKENIITINGKKLAELMIKYNVGCQKDETFEIKKLDEDFFDSLL